MRGRSLSTLLLGFILLALGFLFLAVNLGRVQIHWWESFRLIVPALMLWWGLSKLIRHYLWSEEELKNQPGKAALLSGLFWTLTGLVVTLHLLGLVQGLKFFGTYWPLILVFFGIGKIIDTFRLNSRMPLRAREVFGVICIILLGMGTSRLAQAHLPLVGFDIPWPMGDRDFRLPDLQAPRFSFSEQTSIPAGEFKVLSLKNLYGDVRIEPGMPDEIIIELEKVVFGENEAASRKVADEIRIRQGGDGERLIIGTNREELGEHNFRFNTHFKVLIPDHWAVDIDNSYGEVSATRLGGSCQITNAYGVVRLEHLTGDVVVRNRYQQVTGRNLQGRVRVENRRGQIRLEQINGDLEAHSEYELIDVTSVMGNVSAVNRFGTVRLSAISGDAIVRAPGSNVRLVNIGRKAIVENSHKPAELRQIGGDLELDTSYSRVTIDSVSGPVMIRAAHSTIRCEKAEAPVTIKARGSEVNLNGVQGPINVASSLRRISVRDFTGPVEVQNEFGEIVLRTQKPVVHPITSTNRNGNITLEIPRESSFRLSAAAPGGRINSEFSEAPVADLQVLNQNIGTQETEVRLQTTYARIEIKKI